MNSGLVLIANKDIKWNYQRRDKILHSILFIKQQYAT